MKDSKVYLRHILEAISSIECFVLGKDLHDLETDDMLQSAVIRKFEIIGEAAKRVAEEVKDKSPEIKWKHLAGMRDVMIHDYFFLEIPIIWNTIQKDLPVLKVQVEQLLKLIERD
jgi:uncharacterized protein with HEPN domain